MSSRFSSASPTNASNALGHDKLSTFGIGREHDRNRQFVAHRLIDVDGMGHWGTCHKEVAAKRALISDERGSAARAFSQSPIARDNSEDGGATGWALHRRQNDRSRNARQAQEASLQEWVLPKP